ncbi:hypothetical protein HUT18_11690 [Streptomyces sp. NA04227]|uniref:hypothetical protein n=1 Tax=Streptomyces sp. NA04227 TaxID=2742136 RepID=UPI001591CFD3|nr:hypothetical protein [Streptomyces sp. NA04227]QKW06960.1 hypothetical protein HUT18_11690 [Streptomyces sp. NA04227]
MTFDELVKVGRDTPAYHEDDDCLDCGAETGEPCEVDCEHRGGEAKQAVRLKVAGLTAVEFEELLRVAQKRAAEGDSTPGFSWAWSAVGDEAAARGVPLVL